MSTYATSSFPYNCVVLIESPDPYIAGNHYVGSGVVIGPHTILTASHVVYDTAHQTADQNIKLYPGWAGVDPSLGSGFIATSYTDHFFDVGTFGSTALSKTQSVYDYAIIDTSYTFSSWMGLVTNWQGGVAHMTGYPVNAGGAQTDGVGTVSADPSYAVLDYGSLTSSPGNSGGPIWLNYNGSDEVAGIVSTSAWACQLTQSDIAQIENWVSQDGYGNLVPPAKPLPNIVDSNDIARCGDVTGPFNFIDLLNLEAGYGDLISAFGMNTQAMQNWVTNSEPSEHRPDTFDGLDYVASYGDLINAFKSAGSEKAVLDDGATHYIQNGAYEGRGIIFNGLDYIASYGDLIKAFGVNGDAGAYHYVENGASEGRTTKFDGLDYIASYSDLIKAFGANEQAGAAHFITNGYAEGRTTTFDGLDYIAGYTDLMHAFGANNDAGAAHFINNGINEGRSAAPFNVAAYESAHPDLQGKYATNDAFLTAYISTYATTGNFLI